MPKPSLNPSPRTVASTPTQPGATSRTAAPARSSSPPLAPVAPRLATYPLPKEAVAWSVAPTAGAADALQLAECGVRALAERRLLVVIAASAPDAARLSEEIAWFAPDLRVAQLPDWETLPYDAFSPIRISSANDYRRSGGSGATRSMSLFSRRPRHCSDLRRRDFWPPMPSNSRKDRRSMPEVCVPSWCSLAMIMWHR